MKTCKWPPVNRVLLTDEPTINTGLFRVRNENSAIKIQKIFRGTQTLKGLNFSEKWNKLGNDIQDNEKIVYVLMKNTENN